MTISKRMLIRVGILLVIVFIVIAAIWVYKNPNFKEYSGINMRPTMDVSDNISYGSENVYFARMVQSAGFYTFLHDSGPFTVFVPVDQAYTDLPPSITDTLFQPENSGTLRQFLLYHIVKGRYTTADFYDGIELKTLEGDSIKITKYKGYWLINNQAYLNTYDIVSKNGVIHLITAYLKPPGLF